MPLINSFTLYGISSGSSYDLASFTGIGMPKLFEDNGIYVYGLTSHLLVSVDGGLTLTEILPSGAISVGAITQTSGSSTNSMTHIYTDAGSFKQSTPETIGEWVADNALPTGFSASCAVSDISDSIPLVVGNRHSGTEARIVRSDADAYGSFVQSDTGIPATSPQVVITDLEATV